jgi:hypothetical protein
MSTLIGCGNCVAVPVVVSEFDEHGNRSFLLIVIIVHMLWCTQIDDPGCQSRAEVKLGVCSLLHLRSSFPQLRELFEPLELPFFALSALSLSVCFLEADVIYSGV